MNRATCEQDHPTGALGYAHSGLMALTGPARGAPIVPAVDVIAGIDALIGELEVAAGCDAAALGIDLGELTFRAGHMGFRRAGTRSCNASAHLLEAQDGWIALNLPRSADRELLRPWLGEEPFVDVGRSVARTVRARSVAELLARAEGLPLALAAVPQRATPSTGGVSPAAVDPVDRVGPVGPVGPATARCLSPPGRHRAPRVLDLSSLWAGPLCAQILRRAGAYVIRVESTRRPESTRREWPAWFERLHAGKELFALDFDEPAARAQLREMLLRADIVISSARPRAFEQLGLDPREMLVQKPELIWIAITAHGWHGAAGQRIGFGDDAAAAAGLVAWMADGRPCFIGDAIADPLTGIAAATIALRALAGGQAGLQDVSLAATAARVARARVLTDAERGVVRRAAGEWWLHVADQRARVCHPRESGPARRTARRAA